MKKTKIVATIGPATNTYEKLKELGNAGATIFRLNFSHGEQRDHKAVIDIIKQLNKDTGEKYGIMIDTKGPEIRTGEMKTPLEIKKGQTLILTVDNVTYEESQKIKINYEAFVNDVKVGQTILVDNGTMTLKVLEVQKRDVICTVMDGGMMGSRRHINLSGQDISLPSITEKDWEDIAFAIQEKADFLALSFIRSAEDILQIRRFLEEQNAKIELITKVETLRATQNIDELLEVSDGIMVARGDLGAEIPFEKVPLVQWEIAQKAALYKKPVIVATHMLESMIKEPMPTRAEINDVFTAIWQQNDAIMLSAETSVGKYPIIAVETMTRIAHSTEETFALQENILRKMKATTDKEALCQNAASIVKSLTDVHCIVVLTKTGHIARLASSFRPNAPIYALTEDEAVCRKASILWGTECFITQFDTNPENTIRNAMATLLKQYPKLRGTKCALLANTIVNGKRLNTLDIRTIE